MIRDQTLLILGAGASRPYGFPTGEQLRKVVGDGLHADMSEMKQCLRQCGYSDADIKSFRDTFWLSQKASLDAFLEHRNEFIPIGKTAIAAALVPHENPDHLFDEGNWYRYMFRSMNSTFEEFGQNKLAILTYNYDRSLEHYLFTALKNSYGKSDETCIKKVNSIPIIHLHGQLGPLWPLNDKGRPYQTAMGKDNIRMCVDGIKIIHEDISGQEQFGKAFHQITIAEKICFLGFGYDNVNLKRLFQTSGWEGKSLYGSAFGYTDAEQKRIKSQFPSPIILGHTTYDNLTFLRDVAYFDFA